jgi:hypothetical protein
MIVQNFLFRKHLNDNEKIVAVAHRHFIIVLPQVFKALFFGALIPFFIFILFPQTAMYMLIWMWAGALGLLYHLYDWYFDAWLMTNQGLLDVEWKGMFDKTSTRIEYHMIEGIAYEIKGFWSTIFNYGIVTLEKVGAGTLVQLTNVSHPKKVEQKLLVCQKKYMTQKSMREHGALKDLLTEMIVDHVKEHGIPDPIRKKFEGE